MATVSKATRKRKPRGSKKTYKELLLSSLNQKEWVEEDTLLARVVCKKYGITRAKSTRKKSVLNNLLAGLESGEFRRALEGSNKFWRLGDGTPSADVVLSSSEKTKERTEASARKAAAHLEQSLFILCMDRLQHAGSLTIPPNIEAEIRSRAKSIPIRSQEDLIKNSSINNMGIIITANWDYFNPPLEDKQAFIAKIKELNSLRNRLTHPGARPLSDLELEYFAIAEKHFTFGW